MSFMFRPILSSKIFKTKNHKSEDDDGANYLSSEGGTHHVDRSIVDFEGHSFTEKSDNIAETSGDSVYAACGKLTELNNSAKIDSTEDLSFKIDDLSAADLNDLPDFSKHYFSLSPSAETASNNDNIMKINFTNLSKLKTFPEVEVGIQDLLNNNSNNEVEGESKVKDGATVMKVSAMEEKCTHQDMQTSINSDFDLRTFEKIARPMEPARVPSWSEYLAGYLKILTLQNLQRSIAFALGWLCAGFSRLMCVVFRIAYVGKLIFRILKKTVLIRASIALLALALLLGYRLMPLSQLACTELPSSISSVLQIQSFLLDSRIPESINSGKILEISSIQKIDDVFDDPNDGSTIPPAIIQKLSGIKEPSPSNPAHVNSDQPSFINILSSKPETGESNVDRTITEPSPGLLFPPSQYEFFPVDEEETHHETWKTRFNIFVSVVLPFSFILFLHFFATPDVSVSTTNDNGIDDTKGFLSNKKPKERKIKRTSCKSPAMGLHVKRYQPQDQELDSKIKSFNEMTVPALRNLCKSYRLSQCGPKDDLIRRLYEYEIDCFLMSLFKKLTKMSRCDLVLECKKRSIASSGSKGNLIHQMLKFERDLNSFPARDITKYKQCSLAALKSMASEVGEKVTGNKDDLSYRILTARETRFCTSPLKDVRVALKQSGIPCSGSHEDCARRLAEAGLSLD